MSNTLFLSVDLGTSFIKTGVYDIYGKCLASASEPVKSEKPSPGVFLQRGDDLFGAVIKCIKNTAHDLPGSAADIEAMAFTGQMAGFMGVDENWNDITTWSCSADTRYGLYVKRQQEKLSDKFMRISGTNSPLMCTKYEWFKTEFPKEAEKIAKYVMISGYIIGRLGNLPIEDAPIDGSFITWSGMADVKNRQWSHEICDELGIDMKCLPKIVASNTICGYLAPEMAKITGLKAGIPLVSGAGDKVSGNVGANILNWGDMIFEAGSYGGFSCMVEAFRPDIQEHYFDVITAARRGGFYAHKYIQGSGITLDWFVDNFVTNAATEKKAAFREIEEKAAKISPGSDGVLSIGLLGGSAIPFDSDMKGLWIGHTWSHGKEHFYRSLLESFSYELSLTVDRVEANYPEYDLKDIKIIGGGAKSRLWSQMLADVTGKRFLRLNRDDVALWGAAILAGSAIGTFDDINRVAEKHVAVTEIFTPDEALHEQYEKHKQLYKEFCRQMHDFYVRLSEI